MSIVFSPCFEKFLKERGTRNTAEQGVRAEEEFPSSALCAGERSMKKNITTDWTERRCANAAWSGLPAVILPPSGAGQAERGGTGDEAG